MPNPLPFPTPQTRTERAVVYCMTCGHSTWTLSSIIEARFGYLLYGVLTGLLHCKKGCGDRFGVVLPLDAPTPRAWVQRYGFPPPPPKEEQAVSAPEERLRSSLVEIGEGGTFLTIHARATEEAILHWGFDFLLAKMSENSRTPPRLAVTRGAQWSRDSQRDFKVVPAIPYVERKMRNDWQDHSFGSVGQGPKEDARPIAPRVAGGLKSGAKDDGTDKPRGDKKPGVE